MATLAIFEHLRSQNGLKCDLRAIKIPKMIIYYHNITQLKIHFFTHFHPQTLIFYSPEKYSPEKGSPLKAQGETLKGEGANRKCTENSLNIEKIQYPDRCITLLTLYMAQNFQKSGDSGQIPNI